METNTMTEKEIIQYWVNNRKEMKAFVAAPKECQAWVYDNMSLIYSLVGVDGSWSRTSLPVSGKKILSYCVIAVNEDILKEKESGFIEFDIDENGMFKHQYQSPNQTKRTYWYNFLEAVPSIGIFGGWFFENKAGAGWSIFQMGETSSGGFTTIADDWVKPMVPKKIRFYKG